MKRSKNKNVSPRVDCWDPTVMDRKRAGKEWCLTHSGGLAMNVDVSDYLSCGVRPPPCRRTMHGNPEGQDASSDGHCLGGEQGGYQHVNPTIPLPTGRPSPRRGHFFAESTVLAAARQSCGGTVGPTSERRLSFVPYLKKYDYLTTREFLPALTKTGRWEGPRIAAFPKGLNLSREGSHLTLKGATTQEGTGSCGSRFADLRPAPLALTPLTPSPRKPG